ncbi:UbiA family prenyltransferase [Halobacteriaceae archaeon GCM10025711]
MRVVRHGSGPLATLRAYASQVHPVFMLPPVAASWFGSVLAGSFSLPVAALHATAVFFGLYTAHLKDGYVDFYWRGEDDDHPLTEQGCWAGIVGASVAFFACLAALWYVVDVWAALVSLPGWVIAYYHAPQMDMHPVTATAGYPLGVALAIVGGYYVQAQALSPFVVTFAGVVLVLLAGIKVVDDATDVAYDRSISKRTVTVVLGPSAAHRVAYALMVLGLVGVVGFVLAGVFPPSSVAAVVGFGAVALVARHADPELATMLLIRASYVFLALLVAAVWFRPFA